MEDFFYLVFVKEKLMFENKLVAVINKSCESGIAMNALAHMSFGLGQIVDGDKALLCDYWCSS